jgi:hypothetical protein
MRLEALSVGHNSDDRGASWWQRPFHNLSKLLQKVSGKGPSDLAMESLSGVVKRNARARTQVAPQQNAGGTAPKGAAIVDGGEKVAREIEPEGKSWAELIKSEASGLSRSL